MSDLALAVAGMRQVESDEISVCRFRASTVCKAGALSDLDNIPVGIADVAAGLAVFGDRLCDELRPSAFP